MVTRVLYRYTSHIISPKLHACQLLSKKENTIPEATGLYNSAQLHYCPFVQPVSSHDLGFFLTSP